jgi:TRAP-type transport system small permease protein
MFDRIFKALDRSIETVIVLIFAALIVVGGLQVFNRFVFNQSLSWSEEFQKYAHVWIIYLSIAVGLRLDAHIGMEVLAAKLPVVIQKVLKYMIGLLWVVLALAITVYTGVIMEVARNQTSPGLGVRMDFVYAGLFIGGMYLLIMALRKLAVQIAADLKTGRA